MDVEPRQALLAGRIGLLVRLISKDGMRPALLDLLNTYADGLAEEPGTEVYMLSIDPQSASTVWLYEVFKDEAAQAAHQSSDGFADLMEAMPDLLAEGPAVLPFEPLRLSMQDDIFTEDWTL